MLMLFLLMTGTIQESATNTEPGAELVKNIPALERLSDLEFSETERLLMASELNDLLEAYRALHQWSLGNDMPPALVFQTSKPPPDRPAIKARWSYAPMPARPANLNDLAYLSVSDLGAMIRHRVISCRELTEVCLQRLKLYGPQLECVISLTESRALNTASERDLELANGIYRGPLHGIPYGAKDLLATAGDLTTWGAKPYQNQRLERDAAVITKLDEAGAILVAKLTLGALAWGDVWFGGTTKNPWNTTQGSSGSSAGPAAATSAGLVPFAIGSETYGSIVSPSTRCGVTGFRPTFGAVSRSGAMALSWSMDKLGPITRNAQDCAMVFDAIRGIDSGDLASVEMTFPFQSQRKLEGYRIGVVTAAFSEATDNKLAYDSFLAQMKKLGAELVPIELPDFPVASLSIVLTAEAAAAFDELTRSNRDDQLVRQIADAWPNVFRAARTIPAVEYIQANRHRVALGRQLDLLFESIDVYVCPPFTGNSLLLTNLTGHPSVVLPVGAYAESGIPSLTIVGDLYEDHQALEVAWAYQQATQWHQLNPPDFP